jgi:hypothetical protein
MDIQDTASSHDVSEAKAEPGIRSGKAVLALQDADDSVLGPVLLWFDEKLAESGSLLIQTISQYVSENKIIQVQGEFSELETITFTGNMLEGQNKGNYWDVRVKTFGRQAMSRSGREQLTRTLIELQLLHPQMHRDELLHIIGAADTLTIYDQTSIDRTRQWKELELITTGGSEAANTVEVVMGQNHEIHINMIKKFISSSKWEKLDQNQKLAVTEHYKRHLQMAASEIAMKQAYMQQALKVANVRPPESGTQRSGTQRSGTQRSGTQSSRGT